MSKGNLKFYQVSEVKISYQNKVKLADSPQIRSSQCKYQRKGASHDKIYRATHNNLNHATLGVAT